jgi:hypothetical protein
MVVSGQQGVVLCWHEFNAEVVLILLALPQEQGQCERHPVGVQAQQPLLRQG